MNMAVRTFFVAALVIVGPLALQCFLSSRRTAWPGLILPIAQAALSLLMIFYMAAPVDWKGVVSTLVALNVPTAIELAIYAGFSKLRQEKRKSDRAQQEMGERNIQDQ